MSAFGSQVTTLALPLTAALYLHATAFQMGLLNAAREVAFLGPMLIFGVLVDRGRRKPLMIGTDLGQAALIASVPVLAWTGALAMPVLYLVALVVGCLTSIFSLAYRGYLPSIVDSAALLAGNSRLQATDSVSDIAGPGLAGVLIQLLRAPFALLAQLMLTLFVLSAVRSAHLSASEIGIVFAAFGVGGVVAATTLGRIVARLGYGRLLLAGYVVGALAIIGQRGAELPLRAGRWLRFRE